MILFRESVEKLNEKNSDKKRKLKDEDEIIRKVLIHLKALVQLQKYSEAEKTVDYAFKQNLKHSDLYYMAGEIKRALGECLFC